MEENQTKIQQMLTLPSVPVTRRLGKSNCVGDYDLFNTQSDKLAVCGGS